MEKVHASLVRRKNTTAKKQLNENSKGSKHNRNPVRIAVTTKIHFSMVKVDDHLVHTADGGKMKHDEAASAGGSVNDDDCCWHGDVDEKNKGGHFQQGRGYERRGCYFHMKSSS